MPAISAPDLVLLRTHPHTTQLYLIVHQPPELFHARVQAVPGDATAILTYTNGDVVTNLLSGMTILIGSTYGGHDRRILRLRNDHNTSTGVGAFSMPIAESSDLHSGAIAVNDHITVLEEWRIWPVYPRMTEAAGVISWFKDYDDAWPGAAASLPPVAIAGPPAVAFLDGGPANIVYDGSESYSTHPTGGAVSCAWTFDNGVPGASAVCIPPGGVNYATSCGMEGNRVTLVVTDANGISQVTYRHAFILDREGANAPITDFKLESLRGSFNSGGWTASIRVYGPTAAETNIRPGSQVILFAEDVYGTTAGSIGPLDGRNNLVFVGWIVADSIRQDPETGDVSFEAENSTALMRRMESYAPSVEDAAVPTDWNEVPTLTVNRALRSYYGWQSTLYLTCDVFQAGNWKGTAGTAGDERISAMDFAEGDLYSIGDQFLQNAIIGRVLGDRMSRVRFEMDFQVQANAGTQIFAATNQDWRTEIEIPELEEAEAKQVDLSGTDWDGAAGLPFFSRAPGLVAKYRGTGYRNERFAVHNQAQLNEVSGDKLADLNNPYPALRFPCAGNWRVFDICPQEYFTFTQVTERKTFLSPDDKFIPREVAIEHDAEHGSMTVDVVACYKTDGQDGVTVTYPVTPPTGGGSGSPPPGYSGGGSGADGGGDIVYLLTSDALYRGTNIIADLAAAAVWERISPRAPGDPEVLYNFMIDPFNRDIAYVVGEANGNANGALWRTTNLSATTPDWEVLLTGADLTAAGITGQWLFRIHGAKTQQGFLVVSAPSGALGTNVVVGRSFDRGNTWQWVNVGTQMGYPVSCMSSCSGLEVSDYNAAHVFIGVNDQPGVSTNAAIYHSLDYGATWAMLYGSGVGDAWNNYTWPVYGIHLPEPGNANDTVILAVVDGTGAGGDNTVWQSVDGGVTFTVLNGNPGLLSGYNGECTHFGCDPYNGNEYHFFSDNQPGAAADELFLSHDAGATWTGIGGTPGTRSIQIGTGDRYPGSNIFYYIDPTMNSGSPMFWASDDAGATWTDRTGNFWAAGVGGADGSQNGRRVIPKTPTGTWGG